MPPIGNVVIFGSQKQHIHSLAHLKFMPARNYLIALVALLPALLLQSQNLVQNPSFEDTKPNALVGPCTFMQYSTYFDETLKYWTTYPSMTPDVLTAVENCPWLPQAHTGVRCIGIINYMPAQDVDQTADYHEFVRGSLRSPLIPGQRYRLECWVREDSSIIREHLSQVYSPKTPVAPVKAGNLGFYFYFNNPRDTRVPQVNFPDVIDTKGGWVKLSAEFVAEEQYSFFILGNFYPDKQTKTSLSAEKNRSIELKNGKISYTLDKIKRASYLCVDDISVERVETPPLATMEKALLTEKKFTFSANLLFDFAKSDLKPEAGPALDSLAHFMLAHPGVRIGIGGHTDNVGSDEYNLDLSERRAQAVQQYLVAKGVNAEQLRAKGFGESKPIADNLTEDGRKANRRVECVVLKSE